MGFVAWPSIGLLDSHLAKSLFQRLLSGRYNINE